MAIKLMIDSASDISSKEAEELGIIMVSMPITFGEEEYLDGVNLLPNQFYEKLASSNVLPKTSQISSYQFQEEFENYTKNGDEVILITISSKLSGTYNGAKQVASKFDGKVFVVDSLNACAGERLLALYALKLISQGKSANEIVEELNRVKSKINFFAVIGTLEYLKKGGRISSTVAFAGKLLSIKPIISVTGGEIKLIGKAMGIKKGTEQLNKIIQENGNIDFNMPYGVVWSGLDEEPHQRYIKDSANLFGNNAPAYILGGTIGTHIGPGAIGFAYFEK